MPKRPRLYGLYYFYMCQCGANSQKIQTPKLKKFNEPGAVPQNHNARARQAPEDGPNKSMSSRSTTLVLVISLSDNLKDWISKYLNSKQNFGTIYDFKWNNRQLQSYSSDWDLQLWYCSFLHPSSLEQFFKKNKFYSTRNTNC